MESASQNKELFEKISSFLKKEGATKVAILAHMQEGKKDQKVISTFCRVFRNERSAQYGKN